MDVDEVGIMRGPADMPAIIIVEEGMREGLQIESQDISTADKVRLLDALSRSGLKRIVVGSFVSPKWTPQMADIDGLVGGFDRRPGVIYSALALNARGVERRSAYIPDRLDLEDLRPRTRAHLCDVFAQRNTNRTQKQEIAEWPVAVESALATGATDAEIGIGAAYGSNWVGEFSHEQRMDLLTAQADLWTDAGIPVTRVFFADPMGWNTPWQVAEDLAAVTSAWPEVRDVYLHLHNTRGLASASIYAAMRTLSARHTLTVDTSIGGMAGCPYCGNGRAATLMPTEDFIDMLEAWGYETGVDIDALIDAVALAEGIVGHRLYGQVSKAGPRPQGGRRYPLDLPVIETLEQAQHFRRGVEAYRGSGSPWASPITSWQRPQIEHSTQTKGV